MAKINATYSSGYYINPDADIRKLEDERELLRRKRRRGEEPNEEDVKRQTFAIPFDLICLHCQKRIARGSHVYTNRRSTGEKYLGAVRIWELEIRCKFCQEMYYLRTDPETPKETGGYVCSKFCQRGEGDFYALNKMNAEARAKQEEERAIADKNPLAALERENEAAKQLDELNRQIEEDVVQRADMQDVDLLQYLKQHHRARTSIATQLDDEEEGGGAEPNDSRTRFEEDVLHKWRQKEKERSFVGATVLHGTPMPDAGALQEVMRRLATPSESTVSGPSPSTSGPPVPSSTRNLFLASDDEDDLGVKPATSGPRVHYSRPAVRKVSGGGSALRHLLDDDGDT